MSHKEESRYEKRKQEFVRNYKYCGEGSIFFIKGTIFLIKGGHSTSPMSNAIAGMSPLLLPLTPLTLVGGVVGAIGNTLWGAVALPAAKIADRKKAKHPSKAIDSVNNDAALASSSTNQIFKHYDIQSVTQPTVAASEVVTQREAPKPIASSHSDQQQVKTEPEIRYQRRR